MEADREEEPEKEIVLSPPDPLLLEDFPPPPPPEDIPSLTSVTSSPINNDVSENTSSNDIIDSSQVTSSQNQVISLLGKLSWFYEKKESFFSK